MRQIAKNNQIEIIEFKSTINEKFTNRAQHQLAKRISELTP